MALPILRNPTNHPVRQQDNVRDTALAAWNPWQEFEALNNWFDSFMGRSFPMGGGFAAGPRGNTGYEAAPNVDLYETPDELILYAYVPGAKGDAFDVSLQNGVLTIQGERQPLISDENARCWGSGIARMQGTFQTSYRLPFEVDAEKVNAAYHAGVLEIHLPKAESAKPRTYKVEVRER